MLHSSRPRCAHAKRLTFRHLKPRLETLEDRCVPTGNFFKWSGANPDGDTDWSKADNWQDVNGADIAPTGGGDETLFFPAGVNNVSTHNLGSNARFAAITIDGAGYQISPKNAGDTIEVPSGQRLNLTVTRDNDNNVFSIPLVADGELGFDVHAGASLVVDSVISGAGAGSIEKREAGTLDLRGNNAYLGATDIQGGTLKKGAVADVVPNSSNVTVANGATFDLDGKSESIGALSGNGTVTLGVGFGVTLTVTTTQIANFGGTISGTLFLNNYLGTVTKTGSGAWNISGVINAGVLNINGGTVALQTFHRLDDKISVVMDPGASLNMVGLAETIGSLAGSGSVLLGNGDLVMGGNDSSTSYGGVISGAGGEIYKKGIGVMTLSGANTFSGGAFIDTGTLRLVGANNVLHDSVLLGMVTNTIFDMENREEVIGALAGAGEVRLGTTGSLVMGGNGNTSEFAGVISGEGGAIAKNGNGVMTLTGLNTFTGGVSINAGTLRLGTGGALYDRVPVVMLANTILDMENSTQFTTHFIGSLNGAGEVRLGNGVLVLGRDDTDATYSGVISGAGLIAKNGIGTMTLSGQNTFTGAVQINGGTLKLGAANVLHDSVPMHMEPNTTFDLDNRSEVIGSLSGAGAVTLGSGGLTMGGASDTTYTGVISGEGGSIYKTGAAVMTLSGPNTFTGPVLINAGTLKLGASNVLHDSVAVDMLPNTTFDLNNRSDTIGSLNGSGEVRLGSGGLTMGKNTDTTYTGVISGAGGAIAKNGTGVMTLAGQNTFTRGVFINGGTLRLGADTVLHDSVPVGLLPNTTFDVDNRNETIGSLEGAGEVQLGNGTLTTGGNDGTTIFSGLIHGTGGLIKEGAGSWFLSGANDYSGPTVVNEGILFVRHASALGAANGTTATGTTVLSGATLALNGVSVGNEALILNGSGVNIQFGAFDAMNNSSWTGKVTLASTSTITVAGTNSRLTLSGGVTGAGGLTKALQGTLILAGTSDYTGPTTVDRGTLQVNGSLSSAVTVKNNATLAGTGTVGTVTMNDVSTLSPGASPGILRSGNVSLGATSVFLAELNGAAAGSGYDQLQVTGAVNLGGSTLNALLGFTPALGAKFTIIANDGGDAVSGTFKNLPEGASITNGAGVFRVSYVGGDGNDVVLTRITSYIVTGPDAGAAPLVRVFDAASRQPRFAFLAYPKKFKGGVRVAAADINGDGFPDIITAPGPGTAAIVQVFGGNTAPGQAPALLLPAIKPFGNKFKGGAYVAVGDVNRDGVPDIIVGPGTGTAPTIKLFSGKDGASLGSLNAFPASYKGGVTVAAGDVNGDGKLDIIAGMASGNKALVRVFDAATRAQLPGAIGSFLAYPSSFKGGVHVAAGDVSGDSAAEIITGAGPGSTPLVKVFTPTTVATPSIVPAYPPGQKRGVRVGTADINGDGKAEILTALGPKGSADVRIFNHLSTAAIDSFFAELPSFRRGLFVAGSR